MALPGQTGDELSSQVAVKTGPLSAPMPASASGAGRLSARWIDPMRSESLNYSDAEPHPMVPAAPAPTAASASGPSRASRALAAWRALPMLVRVMFMLDFAMG